jgi:hypothetical protein
MVGISGGGLVCIEDEGGVLEDRNDEGSDADRREKLNSENFAKPLA